MKISQFFIVMTASVFTFVAAYAATGTIAFTSPTNGSQTLNNPADNSCLAMPVAANTPFSNNTPAQITIFATPDCSGAPFMTIPPNMIVPAAPTGANSFESIPK